MIKKILIITALLFSLYTIFIFFKPREYGVSQHQWQDNIIKAQKLVYDSKVKYQTIIVGSSLSCRLVNDSIPNSYNLAFGGLGVYDGLSVLTHNKIWPKYILIESNLIMRKEDRNFTENINNPFFNYLKKKIITLREDKQPLAVLSSYILRFLDLFQNKNIENKFHNTLPNKTLMLNKLININKKYYDTVLSQLEIDEQINELKNFIKILEKNDVKVIFFEMPLNHKLENTYLTKKIRQVIKNRFPNYLYVHPCKTELETTDGLHLTPNAASFYSGFLKSKTMTKKIIF